MMQAAWSILNTVRPWRSDPQSPFNKLCPPVNRTDAVFIDNDAGFARRRLADSRLYITATHGRGGPNRGYAVLFAGETWLGGAPAPPEPLPGGPIDSISQASAVPRTVILTGCETGRNHEDARSLMGACRAKNVANRGGQLSFINFVQLTKWHETFAQRIKDQVDAGGTPNARTAAELATKALGPTMRNGPNLPSSFIFNEVAISW